MLLSNMEGIGSFPGWPDLHSGLSRLGGSIWSHSFSGQLDDREEDKALASQQPYRVYPQLPPSHVMVKGHPGLCSCTFLGEGR